MTQAWEKSVRRIVIGSDHAGFELKNKICQHLKKQGIDAVDIGPQSADSVDYPDFAEKVARSVSEGRFAEGILVCGTGIGMSITANKIPGVRAAVVTNVFMAKSSRGHNDANVLCLGSRVTDEPLALQIVDTWIAEPFEGGRHARRVDKMKELDRAIVALPPKPEEK